MNSSTPKLPLKSLAAHDRVGSLGNLSLVSDDDMCRAEAESYRNRFSFR
jgi:hypothetical protein